MDYRTIFILAMISLVFCAIQLLFCFKAKKIKIKIIPLYIIPLFFILSVLGYTGMLGFLDAGSVISIDGILGLFNAVGAVTALVGNALAWGIYKLLKRK